MKKIKLITYLFTLVLLVSINAFSKRRIGLLVDTGYQGCILNGYPAYSESTNNFNPSVAEKAVSITRLGVFFQGVQTSIGISFLFGFSNIDRQDWDIDTADNGDSTYTIRDHYDVYNHKKSIFGFEFELKFFLVRIIGLKRFAPYLVANLGMFFEKNKQTGDKTTLLRTDYTYGEYASHIDDYNNWYKKKRTGYTRKNFAYYGGLGIGTHLYIFDNFGFDIKLLAVFDNFDTAIYLRGSIGVYYLFN